MSCSVVPVHWLRLDGWWRPAAGGGVAHQQPLRGDLCGARRNRADRLPGTLWCVGVQQNPLLPIVVASISVSLDNHEHTRAVLRVLQRSAVGNLLCSSLKTAVLNAAAAAPDRGARGFASPGSPAVRRRLASEPSLPAPPPPSPPALDPAPLAGTLPAQSSEAPNDPRQLATGTPDGRPPAGCGPLTAAVPAVVSESRIPVRRPPPAPLAGGAQTATALLGDYLAEYELALEAAGCVVSPAAIPIAADDWAPTLQCSAVCIGMCGAHANAPVPTAAGHHFESGCSHRPILDTLP